MLFGAYDVKIGLYKSVKKLRVKIPKIKKAKYRNKIVMTKTKDFYRVHAVFATKKEAKKALAVYKKVFKDAFIAKKQVRLVRPKHRQKVKPKPKPIDTHQIKVQINILNAKTLLENKTVYLCYENGPKHLSDRVVKMVFHKAYMIYHPLKQTSTPVQWAYSFDKNRLILTLLDMQIVHETYKVHTDFISVQSKIDGKTFHKLRYYFDEAKALAFVAKDQNPALGSNPKLGVPKL